MYVLVAGIIMETHKGVLSVSSQSEVSYKTGSIYNIEIPLYAKKSTPVITANAPEFSIIPTDSNLDEVNVMKLNPLFQRSTNTSNIYVDNHTTATKHNFNANIVIDDDDEVRVYSFDDEPSRRFLIVDDAAVNRKMLSKLLQWTSNICIEAEDGVEAMKIFIESINSDDESLKFDAVLLDFEMPNMTGPEVARHMRAMGYKGVIFGVTGNSMPCDIKIFLQAGADRVFIKPIDSKEITNVLRGKNILIYLYYSNLSLYTIINYLMILYINEIKINYSLGKSAARRSRRRDDISMHYT